MVVLYFLYSSTFHPCFCVGPKYRLAIRVVIRNIVCMQRKSSIQTKWELSYLQTLKIPLSNKHIPFMKWHVVSKRQQLNHKMWWNIHSKRCYYTCVITHVSENAPYYDTIIHHYCTTIWSQFPSRKLHHCA